jgi:hypothetical protein
MNLTQQSCPVNGQHFSFTGTSARNSTAIASELVTVHATADCYLKLGGGTVTSAAGAYDFHLVAGQYFYLRTNGATHIAAIQVSAGGTLYINEER